jgi:hypothetical protein
MSPLMACVSTLCGREPKIPSVLKCCKILLENGADPNFNSEVFIKEIETNGHVTSRRGKPIKIANYTPIDFAIRFESTKVIELLINFGATINRDQLYSLFHVPKKNSSSKCSDIASTFELLLKNGCDPYCCCSDKYTNDFYERRFPDYNLLWHLVDQGGIFSDWEPIIKYIIKNAKKEYLMQKFNKTIYGEGKPYDKEMTVLDLKKSRRI